MMKLTKINLDYNNHMLRAGFGKHKVNGSFVLICGFLDFELQVTYD